MSVVLLYVIVLAYFGGTIYLANLQQLAHNSIDSMDARLLRLLLQSAGWIAALLGVFMLLASATVDELAATGEPVNDISLPMVLAGVLVSALAAGFIFWFIGSAPVRQWVAARIHPHGRFNPENLVHITAVVLSVLLVAGLLVNFWASGGSESVEETAQEISVESVLLQNIIFIMVAFLGIGYAIRRGGSDSLKRLGLRVPTEADLRWGIGMGIGFVFGLSIMAVLLLTIFGDLNDEAAISQAEALSAPPFLVMLVLLIFIAVGEEIFIRGALLPVLGNPLSSAIFVLMHAQLLTSPLIVVLIVLSMALGWLRTRQSTTAAIIAHFCYNLVQLL